MGSYNPGTVLICCPNLYLSLPPCYSLLNKELSNFPLYNDQKTFQLEDQGKSLRTLHMVPQAGTKNELLLIVKMKLFFKKPDIKGVFTKYFFL